MAMTMKKIAELAGVSRGTVDRVLHGRGGVKPDVTERIRSVAHAHGYKPNIIGKALAGHRKPVSIGVVINGVGNPFFDDVLAGIEAAKNEFSGFGINILQKSSKGYSTEKQLALLEELEEMNISGLSIAPINNPRIAEKINSLCQKGVKTVIFNSDIDNAERLAFVGCDYFSSGKNAANLLCKFLGGRGKVLVVYGSSKMLGHTQRLKGFKALTNEKFPDIKITDFLECNDDDMLSEKLVDDFIKSSPVDGVFFAAGGVAGGIQALMSLKEKPVIITCDETAFIREMMKAGIIDATIGQEPFVQGYMPIKIIFDSILSNTQPEKSVYYTKNEIRILY